MRSHQTPGFASSHGFALASLSEDDDAKLDQEETVGRDHEEGLRRGEEQEVFGVDVLSCERCGGRMRLIASLERREPAQHDAVVVLRRDRVLVGLAAAEGDVHARIR